MGYRSEMGGSSFSESEDNHMPGTILGAASRQRIAECHIQAAKSVSDRKGLLAIYRASRVSLQKGELFDSVTKALVARADELGVNLRKGAKNA